MLDPDQSLCRSSQGWMVKGVAGAAALPSPGSRSPSPPPGRLPPSIGERLAMPLQFHRVVEQMEIWSAIGDGYSFVISFESPAGPGLHGKTGYVASWRPVYESGGAIRITGSPFGTIEEAE